MPAKPFKQLMLDQTKAPPSGRLELMDPAKPGFGLRISSSDARSWFVRYRVEGRERRMVIGNAKRMTLAEARKAADEALGSVDKGVDPAIKEAPKPAPVVHTVQATFAAYERNYMQKHLKIRSQEEIRRAFKKYVLPAIGDRPISGVGKRDVRDVVEAIAASGTETQANRTLSYARAFFNWAASEEFIEHSPAEKIAAPAPEKSRDRVLNDREIAIFWKAAEQLSYPFGDLWRLLLLTGQRRNETATLEWPELNFAERMWTIPKEKSKNKQTHDVHLSEPALEIIEGIRTGPRKITRFVFTRTEETAVSGFSQAKRRLDDAMTALNGGEPIADWRIHDLRRTAATVMTRSLKIPPHIVDRVLNHAHRSATGVGHVYNRYEYFDERSDALERLGAYIASLPARDDGRNAVELANRMTGSRGQLIPRLRVPTPQGSPARVRNL